MKDLLRKFANLQKKPEFKKRLISKIKKKIKIKNRKILPKSIPLNPYRDPVKYLEATKAGQILSELSKLF